MLTDLKNWIAETLAGNYKYFFGMWVESEADDNVKYCVIQSTGGPGANVDDRYPRYRVILLGVRNGSDADEIYEDSQLLMNASLSNSYPCETSSIRATSEPTGPGFTAENRAFMQLNFETIL